MLRNEASIIHLTGSSLALNVDRFFANSKCPSLLFVSSQTVANKLTNCL